MRSHGATIFSRLQSVKDAACRLHANGESAVLWKSEVCQSMSQVVQFVNRPQKIAGARVAAGAPRVRVKTVALPNEHGGWGLLLEPVALGLLVVPSWPRRSPSFS